MKLGFYILLSFLLSLTNEVVFARGAKIDNNEFAEATWLQDSGEPISIDRLNGDILVASLFYTNCPNTCNLTVERFKQLEVHLAKLGISAQFVLMSLDPKNDTPKVLKSYRESRGLTKQNWYFLTSDENQVASTARQLGYEFMELDDHVFHRMKIFLMDTSGDVLEVITMKTKINKIVLDIEGAKDVG